MGEENGCDEENKDILKSDNGKNLHIKETLRDVAQKWKRKR